jgi:hypothetical protein
MRIQRGMLKIQPLMRLATLVASFVKGSSRPFVVPSKAEGPLDDADATDCGASRDPKVETLG